MAKRVLVLGGLDYSNLFLKRGYNTISSVPSSVNLSTVDDVDLICFTGGTDVNPSRYDEERHNKTQFSDLNRDKTEQKIFDRAVKNGIPMVGICRGAQFGCIASGGSLIQHVTKHNTYHPMTLYTGEKIQVSSDHHQMMQVRKVDHILLGWGEGRSDCYEGMKNGRVYKHKMLTVRCHLPLPVVQEPEVVYFPETNFLAHQPHPEWMNKSSPYQEWFFQTITEFLKVCL